jgi:toxin ParE1/3/4
MKLRYHALARKEVVNTAKHYSALRSGLGDEFLAELHRYIDRIIANPLRFEQIKPGVRRCLMNRFPYGIYFHIPDADTVRIIVVRHHRRRPSFGLKRK